MDSIAFPIESLADNTKDRRPETCDARIKRAWAHWKKVGEPKLIVAPMVDNSELPFRLLCRKYGAEAAYTPMLDSCIFAENEKYRSQEFTTCKEDRPLFVQFSANDPDTLLEAARMVEPYCDYVDINLGCPTHIAKQENYGSFLMDNLPLVKSLVEKLALNLTVPVSCKIRVFPDLGDTLKYAKMLEEAGCALLAVHGRTRDEKDMKNIRANWNAIKAVKTALRIPVLANGNIRHMDDVIQCLEETGGENKYPVPWRIIRDHVDKMLGEWFRVHPHIRDDFNAQSVHSFEYLYGMVNKLRDVGVVRPVYVKNI
ncbi:tRNA-dihydrouridine(16/17) synthase [NAD(P)(+)]-like protein [Tanacetum coccineum]